MSYHITLHSRTKDQPDHHSPQYLLCPLLHTHTIFANQQPPCPAYACTLLDPSLEQKRFPDSKNYQQATQSKHSHCFLTAVLTTKGENSLISTHFSNPSRHPLTQHVAQQKATLVTTPQSVCRGLPCVTVFHLTAGADIRFCNRKLHAATQA
jgi:hypothetical protein